jgi:endonuclease/exonuclease/phosphatase (EEP) superfamily protein YafD
MGAVRVSGANVVTPQEVSAQNKFVLGALADVLPTHVYCYYAIVGGVAVLSSYPAIAGTEICAALDGVAAVQVQTSHRPFWLVSIHLEWPWPHDQASQVARLIPVLEQLDGHVIVGGDFNAVAWSHSVAAIGRATGTDVIGPHARTFTAYGFPLGIDHILTGPAFAQQVDVMPKFGSDHHGVLAYLTRPSGP